MRSSSKTSGVSGIRWKNSRPSARFDNKAAAVKPPTSHMPAAALTVEPSAFCGFGFQIFFYLPYGIVMIFAGCKISSGQFPFRAIVSAALESSFIIPRFSQAPGSKACTDCAGSTKHTATMSPRKSLPFIACLHRNVQSSVFLFLCRQYGLNVLSGYKNTVKNGLNHQMEGLDVGNIRSHCKSLIKQITIGWSEAQTSATADRADTQVCPCKRLSN